MDGPAPARSRAERGISLVELLIAIVVLGIIVAAASVAVTTLVVNSDRGRRTAEASDLLVAVTETIVDPATPYYSCTASAYPALLGIPAGVVQDPTSWVAQITSVQCLARYGTVATFVPTTTGANPAPTGANQVQLITVDVRKTDGRASRAVTVMKRNPGV